MKMKTILTSVVLSCLVLCAFGQGDESDDILTTSTKRNGLYKTYSEFRTNSPSVVGSLKVTNHKIKILDEKTGKYENVKGDYWGACTNDTIYVLLMQPATQQSPHIYPLEFIGRYCYFSERGAYTQMTASGGMYTGGYSAEYVVNINNGQIYKLDKKLMRAILEKDPELLERYEKEEWKSEVFKDYILKINERRTDDIKIVGLD